MSYAAATRPTESVHSDMRLLTRFTICTASNQRVRLQAAVLVKPELYSDVAEEVQGCGALIREREANTGPRNCCSRCRLDSVEQSDALCCSNAGVVFSSLSDLDFEIIPLVSTLTRHALCRRPRMRPA